MAANSCGLSEDCIAVVLSLTTPKDACRLSAIASTFRSAAESDFVWERFLPSDYHDVLSCSIGGSGSLLPKFESKKDLYLHLSDHPILIDGGLKSFWLEKQSGKKCYMLAARGISIIWGDTSRYWRWVSHPESRFSEVAELLDVCWFEVRGHLSTKMLSFDTNYAAYLVFKTTSNLYGFRQNFHACVGIKGHEMDKRRRVCLDPEPAQRRKGIEYSRQRADEWMEIELGEYFASGEADDMEMSLLEVKRLNSKHGLLIQGIEIRPKNHA